MTIKDIRNLPKDLDRQISKDFNASPRFKLFNNIVQFIQDFLLQVGLHKEVL